MGDRPDDISTQSRSSRSSCSSSIQSEDLEALIVPLIKKPQDATSSSDDFGGQKKFKACLLVLFVLQATSAILTGRYCRSSVPESELFEINHLIFVIEAVKFILSIGLEYVSTKGKLCKSVNDHVLQRPCDCFKVLVPAVLYVIQNSLVYIGLSNLTAPVFISLQQFKLIATAIVSVLMLNRSYNLRQWLCLVALAIGVAIIALGEYQNQEVGDKDSSGIDNAKKPEQVDAENAEDESFVEQFFVVGFLAVTGGSFTSAFAGVYFEKVLAPEKATKDGNRGTQTAGEQTEQTPASPPVPSLWMRNMQLSTFCMIFAFFQGIYDDQASVKDVLGNTSSDDEFSNDNRKSPKTYLYGFTVWVWLLVLLQACGGLLVAAVICRLDNVIKGLANGISVVSASVMSAWLFDVHLSSQFYLGAAIIFCAVYLFSNDPPMPQCGGKTLY